MNAKRIAHIIIVVTGVFAIGMLFLFLLKTTPLNTNLPINTSIFANYGSLVGGISASLLSLASVFLIIQSIKEQEKSRILQNIESRFFELLKFTRENSENINSKGKSGRTVFIQIKTEFNSLFNTNKAWYTLEKSNLLEKEWKRNLICITYLIIFFGVDDSQYDFLKENLKKVITDKKLWHEFENNVLKPLSNDHRIIKQKNSSRERATRLYLKYDGYQNILGHYFRNLFQTVKFINNQPALTYIDKYNYIKILRAQLSTFEQVMFFYNSLSTFGFPWEKSTNSEKYNEMLITKYNIVKNITFKLNAIIDVRDYYPLVTYEGSEKSNERIMVEESFS